MKSSFLCITSITIFLVVTFLPPDLYSQGFRRTRNTQSNLDFFVTNKGVLFNNDAIAGFNWPRGTSNSYIFGGGLWFAGKKYFPGPSGQSNPWSSAGGIEDSLFCICANPQTRNLLIGSLPLSNSAYLSGFYLLPDTEKTWRNINILKRMSVNSIVTLPNGKELVGADTGLFIGADNGSWIRLISKERVSVISNYGVTATNAKSTSPSNIYTPDANLTTWTLRHTFTGTLRITNISSLPGNEIIIASSSSGIWMSRDTGQTWNVLPVSGLSGIVSVLISTVDTSIFVATSTDGVFQSFDQGKTWTPHNLGLSNLSITALKSADGRTFAAGTKSGIFILSYGADKSASWVDKSAGIPGSLSVTTLNIDANGDLHVILAGRRIYTTWHSAELKPGFFEVCEIGFNPNSGTGWFTQGENGLISDEYEPKGKYSTYLSTSFDQITGLPNKHDSSTPQYRWPVWTSAGKAFSIKTNFNFGTRISSVTERDSLAALGEKPVFISQEDILNTYSDLDSTANPEFQSGTGYPLGLVINESIYSWSFGRYRDLVYIRYQVKNSSNDTLRDCFLAPAFDPDLGVGGAASANDINSYFGLTPQDSLDCRNLFPVSSPFHSDPTALNLGRQWSKTEPTANPPGEYGCLGFAFVETPVLTSGEVLQNGDSLGLGGYGPNSLFKKNRIGLSSFRQWSISNDPGNAALRYNFIGTSLKDHNTSIIADMRLNMSTGPFTMKPNGIVTTTLAIGIARPSITVLKDNLDSLVKLMAFAHDFFENPISQTGDPNSVTIHHFEGAPTVSVKQTPTASQFDVFLFPNPTMDLLKARATSNIEKVDILNILGETVMQQKNISSQDFTLDLSKLLPGTYFIRFTSANSVVMKKVIRE
ncbi:MAG: T9SS type A sorting domain-containing protein [Candidatus Kapaibacterium sp.]